MSTPASLVAAWNNQAELSITNGETSNLLGFLSGSLGVADALIRPGQPIALTWQFWSFLLNKTQISTARVTINIYTRTPASPKFAVSKVATVGPVQYVSGGISGQLELRITPGQPQPSDALLKEIYSTSDEHLLYLEVLAADGVSFVVSTTVKFLVYVDDVAQWSQWDVHPMLDWGARARAFPWNEQYSIAAIWPNLSSSGLIFTGQAALQESTTTSVTPIWNPVGTLAINNVNPLQQVALNFPALKKNWSWLTPVVWIVSGDRAKSYLYRIVFNLVDQYGNPYVSSTEALRVTVAVSDQKWEYGLSAMATEITALVLYALSWLITPVPGSLAAGAATALGAAAKDPPLPSEAYATMVSPVALRASKVPKNRQPRPLYVLLAAAHDFGSLRLTLYEIEARILGAVLARDARATAMQKDAYESTLRQLKLTAELARESAEQATEILESREEFDAARIRAELSRWKYGAGALSELKLSDHQRRKLSAAIASEELMTLASRGLTQNLGELTNAMIRAAFMVTRDSFRIRAIQTPSEPSRKSSKRPRPPPR